MASETKVILLLVSSLFLGELVVRNVEPMLSSDVRNMLGYSDMAANGQQALSDGRGVVVVLGNSLIRSGIETATFNAGLQELGYDEPLVLFLTPDGTGVNEWVATYRKHISLAGIRPDLLIVGTGPDHLLDQPVRSPERLAAFHASKQDRYEILVKWMEEIDERCRFVFAGFSRLIANRGRVRPLILYNLVPGFEETAARINRTQTPSSASGKDARTDRIEWLLDSITLPPDRVVVVAVPLPQPYELSDLLLESLESRATVVLQFATKEMPEEAFPDGYHLSKPFAKKFTEKLLSVLPNKAEKTGEKVEGAVLNYAPLE